MERPAKRAKLLSDSEVSDEEPTIQPVSKGNKSKLSINKDFAQRFEHNKQREERHRLEEKLKDNEEDGDSSTDESEDDEADLITDVLDNEIMSTLQAIKAKDPRVYDKNVKFYREFEGNVETSDQRSKKETPMTLKDYHRENLLAGYTGAEEEQEEAEPLVRTYDQEQDSLRRDMVSQMHAMAADSDDDEDGDFMRKTKKGVHEEMASARTRQITETDVKNAEQDPETFLSNFMAAQAWRTDDASRPHAFDSDDSNDEARADAFEDAYNMRFEDPAKANETLKSFARDTGKYTVRREDAGGRKRARDRERTLKEEAKKERDEDRARLRKLKIDETEKKLKMIKHVAGLEGQDIDLQEWRDLLDGDFSDDAWDREMSRRFNEKYYAEKDTAITGASSSKQPTKPVWDDDIDIGDLVPDFNNDTVGTDLAMSDEEASGVAAELDTQDAKAKSKKDREHQKREAKAQHRRERRGIEDIVDAALPVVASNAGAFRYRETSPNSFGMNSRDILFASDAQLNQFAGLKKLAAFRDEERKVKDRKKLGKKARLREWRKEVFGNPEGAGDRDFAKDDQTADEPGKHDKDGHHHKKKRSRKSKSAGV